MRYEAKHSYFKRLAKNAYNFRNTSYRYGHPTVPA